MKKIYSDLRKGEVKVKVESLDDLWFLSQIIDPGDKVSGTTVRKIKIGSSEDRKQSVVQKTVHLSLEVVKVEFHAYSNTLRVLGKITAGPDDIPLGSHHTFNVELNTVLTIIKESWPKYQLERLEEALNYKPASVLICVFDREDAYFALTKQYGYDILVQISGDVEKKVSGVITKGAFYEEIIRLLEEYSSRYSVKNIILASPAFWKEDLMKLITSPELKKRIVLATCSSATENAVHEVLKRPEIEQVLKKERASRDLKFIDELLAEISTDGACTYGLKQTSEAVNLGAVRILLVTDTFIQDVRAKNIYKDIDNLLKTVESLKGEIHIISGDNDAGKKLNGLGGIASLLRYKLKY